MLSRILIATTCSVLLAGAANAQVSATQNSTTSQANSAVQSQSNQNIPQEIKQKLASDGFTDVKVVPGSFLVSAKDKQGDPVMMVIGPHSMTILTELPGSNSSTTGSNPSSSQSNGMTQRPGANK
jgi:hypothetical protein